VPPDFLAFLLLWLVISICMHFTRFKIRWKSRAPCARMSLLHVPRVWISAHPVDRAQYVTSRLSHVISSSSHRHDNTSC
jgi:hypothetical protein